MSADNQPIIDEIHQILCRAAERHGEAVRFYWPSSGDNNLPEGSLVVAAAAEFAAHGYHVWGEVQHAEERREKIDLLAISPEKSIAVALEAKRLDSAGHAWSLVEQRKRPENHALSGEFIDHGSPKSRKKHRKRVENLVPVRVMVASTWYPSIADWWKQPEQQKPAGKRSEAWKKLRRILKRCDARWGEELIPAWPPADDAWRYSWLHALQVLDEGTWDPTS